MKAISSSVGCHDSGIAVVEMAVVAVVAAAGAAVAGAGTAS